MNIKLTIWEIEIIMRSLSIAYNTIRWDREDYLSEYTPEHLKELFEDLKNEKTRYIIKMETENEEKTR